MSRYQQLMTEILDSIFEGYTMENGKLSVLNEDKAKKASDTLHTLVLEKSRDLWDQLEASSDSLAEYSDEIDFEEMTADPSSVSNSVSFRPKDEDEMGMEDDMESGMGSDLDLEDDDMEDTFESVSNLFSSEEINFDEIFTEHGHDHLDDEKSDDEPNMPFDEDEGDDSTEEMVDGDDDYDDLMIGMDDAGLGSSTEETELDDEDFENADIDPEMDSEMDSEMEPEMEPEMDSDDGFDFDLDLDSDVDSDVDSDEMDSEEDDDEEMMDGMGHQDKSYRME